MPLVPSPPKALTRKDDDNDDTLGVPGKTTGAEVTSTEGQRRRKKPERQMHNIEPKKPTPKTDVDPKPKHPVIAYLKEQAKIRKEDDFIFLLWGSAFSEMGPTYAVDVTIPDHFKNSPNWERNITPWISSYGTIRIHRNLREAEVFAYLKRRYYAEIGPLYRYFFFRKVARVKLVNFRFISRTRGRFRVSMELIDLSCFRKKYDEIIAKTHEKMNWRHFEDPDRDEDSEMIQRCEDCGHEGCDTYYELLGTERDECPGRQRKEAEKELQWAQNADLLTFYFRNPSLACGQNMLSSSPYVIFGQWERMNYIRDTVQQNWWEERGLYIETCFDTTRLLRTTLILLILVVVLGKLAWGSWDIVFGAGSFFVAIPMLVLTALSYTDG